MDILKVATEWAKDEVFSSRFFIVFGVMFALATLGFWQLGRTEVAKAFVYPTLVAAILLLAIGIGIFFTNKSRATSFPDAYQADVSAFVKSEIARTERSMGEYNTAVFRVIPFIIVAAALLIVFVHAPLWRAISITTIGLMAVIMFVDSNANARLEIYHEQLQQVNKEMGN
ncbi:MAG: hypothetical protein AAFQ98_19805 [Bacteroidota bacterium]